MISFQKSVYMSNENGEPVYYGEGVCLSTDEKPGGMANGSALIEMDTGKLFLYDASGNQWREIV